MPRQVEATALAKTITGNEGIGAIRYALSGRVLQRNLLIALVVGSLLTLGNQFDVILRGSIHASLLAKISFNFAIPFVVSSVSASANRCGR